MQFPLTHLPYTYYLNYFDYLCIYLFLNVLFIILILLYFVNNTYTHEDECKYYETMTKLDFRD